MLSFTRAADQVLVVTTPEPTAITDAYAVIKVISKDRADRHVSLLVNQVRSASEAKLVHERVAKVAKNFLGVNVLDAGHMVADDHVRRAVLRRVPILASPKCAPASAWRFAMRRTGDRPSIDGGFVNRMSRWFKRSQPVHPVAARLLRRWSIIKDGQRAGRLRLCLVRGSRGKQLQHGSRDGCGDGGAFAAG